MKKDGLSTIVKELKAASEMHLRQSQEIEKHIDDMSPIDRTKKWYERKENRHTNLVEKGKTEKAAKLRDKIDKNLDFDAQKNKQKEDGTKPPKTFGNNVFTTLTRN